MAILAINTNTTGLVGPQVNPRRCTMVTTDTLAAITTPGYLTNQNTAGNPILPTDIFEIIYAYNQATNIGTLGFFQVTINISGAFTLSEWINPGSVLLPVVNGDIAVFNGTTGQIKDGGPLPVFGTAATKAASNNALPSLASITAATTINQIPQFNDVSGTIGNSGVLVSGLQLKAQIKAVSVSWAGGSTTNAFTIPGITAASIVIPSIQAQTTGTSYIVSYALSVNTITVTFSSNPGAMVLQAIGFIVAQ